MAIVCLLLLRGPQTPGELRTRSNRLHDFKDVLEVEACIKQLMERDKPVLTQLPREPGKRECRYTELFSQGSEQVSATSLSADSPSADSNSLNAQDRQQLEARVTQLEGQVAELKDKLESLIASLS